MDMVTTHHASPAPDLGFFNGSMVLFIGQSDSPISQNQEGSGNGGTLQPGTGGSGQPQTPGGTGPGTGPAWNPLFLWLPLLLVFVFLLWSSNSSQKKEKRKREQMLSSINKHDKVQTIGGVIGSVVEIKDNEVILKVDEANNVKMRFAKSAVQQVISEAGAGE